MKRTVYKNLLKDIYDQGRSHSIKSSDSWSDFYYYDDLIKKGYTGPFPKADEIIELDGFEIKNAGSSKPGEKDKTFWAFTFRPLEEKYWIR